MKGSGAGLYWREAPSRDLVALLDRCDADHVLVGPGRDPDGAEISTVFAARFKTALADLEDDLGMPGRSGSSLEGWGRRTLDELPVAVSGDARIRIAPAISEDMVPVGVVLLEKDARLETPRIKGVFTGPTLCLDRAWRGRGYGSALVAARLIMDEWLPTWDHDTPGYSPAGAATARAGAKMVLGMGRYPTSGPSF